MTTSSPQPVRNPLPNEVLKKVSRGKSVKNDFIENRYQEDVTQAICARFNQHFANHPIVKIRPFGETSGISIFALSEQGPLSIVNRNLIVRGIRAYFTILFAEGLFHDQVNGECFSVAGSDFQVGDFQRVRRLSKTQRQLFFQILLAIKNENFDKLARVLQGSEGSRGGRPLLANDLHNCLSQALVIETEKQKISHLLTPVLQLGEKYSLNIPQDLVVLQQFVVEVEAWSDANGCELSLFEHFTAMAAEEINQELLSMNGLGDYAVIASEWKSLLSRLPGQIEQHLQHSKQTDLGALSAQLLAINQTLRQLGFTIILAIALLALSFLSALFWLR